MEREARVGEKVLRLVEGDITDARVDAVVNAANEALVLGEGVAGAIRRKGGPGIQEECNRLAPIRTGEAVLTGAGKLPARYVIHTVGPRGGQPAGERLLRDAVESSLRQAEVHHLHSVAFPAISTGVYGYPLEDCARTMTRAAVSWLREPAHDLREIRFVLFDTPSFRAFEKALPGALGEDL